MPARGLLGHGPGPGGRAPAPATHDETPTTAVTDLTAPGAPRTPPAGGHDVASDTGADTTTLSRTQPNMPEQAQNTPKTPWGQVVFAPLMMSLIFSAGVCPFKTRRGRRLRRSWTAWTWASVTSVKLVPLGKYSRISPPVFSLVGR